MNLNLASFLSISLVLLLSAFLPTTVSANVVYEKPLLGVMSDQSCGDKLCSEIKAPTPITISSIAYFPPPLKQISYGVSPFNVTCTEGKTLVLKQSNGLPACLNPPSVEKLILRGWAIHILPDHKYENNNSGIFALGEFMTESETVTYFDDTSGYLSKPVIDGNYPGIVMIHEWWGLNDNIKEMADKLASHGYVVLAVDLYDGKVATTSEQARQLISTYDSKRGVQNMNSATTFLIENYSIEDIGSIGWCFGGGQSLNLALSNEDMDATVIYYGQLVTDEQEL
ncbi:MAG: dienelactone hydrolase family protein [Nitrosopumilus sp.]|nr:dienelactone hydrolase family protein [Nitrosopumilus sp.]